MITRRTFFALPAIVVTPLPVVSAPKFFRSIEYFDFGNKIGICISQQKPKPRFHGKSQRRLAFAFDTRVWNSFTPAQREQWWKKLEGELAARIWG